MILTDLKEKRKTLEENRRITNDATLSDFVEEDLEQDLVVEEDLVYSFIAYG